MTQPDPLVELQKEFHVLALKVAVLEKSQEGPAGHAALFAEVTALNKRFARLEAGVRQGVTDGLAEGFRLQNERMDELAEAQNKRVDARFGALEAKVDKRMWSMWKTILAAGGGTGATGGVLYAILRLFGGA